MNPEQVDNLESLVELEHRTSPIPPSPKNSPKKFKGISICANGLKIASRCYPLEYLMSSSSGSISFFATIEGIDVRAWVKPDHPAYNKLVEFCSNNIPLFPGSFRAGLENNDSNVVKDEDGSVDEEDNKDDESATPDGNEFVQDCFL